MARKWYGPSVDLDGMPVRVAEHFPLFPLGIVALPTEVTTTGTLGGTLDGLLNSTILPTLTPIVTDAVSPVLNTVLTGLVDPTLNTLGVGIGEMDVAGWLEHYRRFWDESFDRLDEYLQQLQDGGGGDGPRQ